MEQANFSELSYKLTNDIDKQEKKDGGIYFTPPKTINKNIKLLEPYMKNIKKVLEPSCGSCEFILKLASKYSKLDITGIEINKTIFESIKNLESDNLVLKNANYLSIDLKDTYDLIIGNPPYFVMKSGDISKEYNEFYDGRPNIFVLFIIKSLKLLNKNGILSFVLPKSFLNCLYYDKTRKYIINNYTILDILDCSKDKYIETQQNTILLFLINKKPDKENENFTINVSDYSFLGTKSDILKLKELYKNSTSLFSLDFNVNVGNIVWNQCKKELTDDTSKTLLIYSSDIKNGVLNVQTYSNKEKKNYIHRDGLDDPILIINRGYGVGKYIFNYCLINENKEDKVNYLIENHLVCIKYTKVIEREDLIKKYNKIINSFRDKRTEDFIKIYFGNNAINTTELAKILPIYEI